MILPTRRQKQGKMADHNRKKQERDKAKGKGQIHPLISLLYFKFGKVVCYRWKNELKLIFLTYSSFKYLYENTPIIIQ